MAKLEEYKACDGDEKWTRHIAEIFAVDKNQPEHTGANPGGVPRKIGKRRLRSACRGRV